MESSAPKQTRNPYPPEVTLKRYVLGSKRLCEVRNTRDDVIVTLEEHQMPAWLQRGRYRQMGNTTRYARTPAPA